jgi:pilus assembly protein FimV
MVFKRWQIIAGIALFVASTVASALSLGRVRGTALLGRGLDLSVQATLDVQEAVPEVNCLAVELFYGDTRVSPNAVSVSPERTSGGELRIRIRASTVVDEPVVTLFVRSSCPGAAISRRYVLLAEMLTDAEPSGAVSIAPAITPPAPAAPLTTPRIAFGGAPAGSSGATNNQAPSSAEERRAERAAKRQAQREARQQRQAEAASRPAKDIPVATSQRAAPPASVVRKSAVASAPRLKIDLIDLTAAEPSLRGSNELASAPSGDEAVHRQAQALWRTLNASPEDALRDAQRLETLEAQMRTALEQSKRQGQDIATLSTELQAAQKARYVNPFTIFLGLLTLAALALSLLLWQRSRSKSSGQPWWGGSSAKAEPKDEQHLWKHLGDGGDSVMSPLQTSSNNFSPNATSPGIPALSKTGNDDEFTRPGVLAEKGSQGPLRFVEKPTAPIDFKANAEKISLSTAKIQPLGTSVPSGRGGSMGKVDSTPPPSLMQPPASSRAAKNGFGNTDFAASGFSNSRVVAAEELFDIQEQADFFLSLGQPDQAIEVLKNHITDNVETSALAYMDLFDIYHRTNRQADYTELREEFNRVFNAQVPEFAKYGAQSNGLEDFPHVLSNIQAAWSRPLQAQDVIEESIFRHPDQDHQTLDMAAYRELMLLYALAKELARPDAAYSMLPISMQTPVLPIGGVSNTPDVDLGDGLVLSSPMDDLLSPEDRTVSLPEPLLKANDLPNEDGSLDFDLSDAAELSIIKMPNAPKVSKKI